MTLRSDSYSAALEAASVALDDWLNTYADDMCDPKRVQEAHKRIGEWGTIGYIAHVQKIIREALYRRHDGPKLRVERGEAVNLARTWLDKDSGGWDMQTDGIRLLADAVMRMDAALLGGPHGELRVLFDGPPSHESGRFVECEDASGKGVNAGEWRERPDKLWELVITTLPHATRSDK